MHIGRITTWSITNCLPRLMASMRAYCQLCSISFARGEDSLHMADLTEPLEAIPSTYIDLAYSHFPTH